ncbi:hypothetical protein BRADO6655 [Bradyrhizobium sp. ORS 278]|uniref:hypothetical protein n=1 Tax=Bradyrhizobium sp. (strain ORS 278) TaxID=114615 RepID=UPI00015080D1|nr:hypothetical protein [Bradyrhizobium sp. ORS 278]CAL80259.1 hypothetical protein BRADO6655 [Bradyrhizobium sp. ORS 278]
MIKIFTDFNARTNDDLCWLLKYRERDLAPQIDALQLRKGDRIILFHDDGDFEVIAMLDYRFVEVLGRDEWVAIPDWDTLVRK